MTATQITLDDAVAAGWAGAEAAADTAGDEWAAIALDMLRGYLTTHATMHVDDLWQSLPSVSSPRALGAVVMRAKAAGWMTQATHDGCVLARPSVRSNGQLKAVWRSHLFDGGLL